MSDAEEREGVDLRVATATDKMADALVAALVVAIAAPSAPPTPAAEPVGAGRD